jgi:CBS domain-containing protein
LIELDLQGADHAPRVPATVPSGRAIATRRADGLDRASAPLWTTPVADDAPVRRKSVNVHSEGTNMRAYEVMTSDVETVPPTMPADQAWELMRRKDIRHLVVSRGADVVGILSQRDMGGRGGAALRTGRTAQDLMTQPVVTVKSDATVRSIANLMRGRTIGCVPVLQRSKLVGIVTISDLLDLLGHGGERPARNARSPLHYRVAHRKQRRMPAAW